MDRALTTKKKIAFTFVVLALFAIASELSYRLYVAVGRQSGPLGVLYTTDPELGMVHNKDVSAIVDWAKTVPHTVSFNSFGFRGPNPRAIEKEPGVCRVVILGGSTTEEVFVADGKTWPELLQRQLNASRGREAIEVVNLAIMGCTIKHNIRNLVRNGLPLRPDVVVVYEAHNDFFQFLESNEGAWRHHGFGDYEAREPTAIESILCKSSIVDHTNRKLYYSGSKRRDYTFAYWNAAEKADIDLTGVEAPTIDSLNQLYDLSIQNHFSLVVGIQADLIKDDLSPDEVPYMWDIFRIYNKDGTCIAPGVFVEGLRRVKAAQKQWAREHGVLCIDVEAALPKALENFVDHIHSTEKGSALIAEAFAQGILQAGLIKD